MTGTATPPADILIRTQNVAVGYGPETVLRSVSLEIRRGEFWCLLGTNGAGKTSLLRTLLGLLPPQGGRIDRHRDVGTNSIGFVPQHCGWSTTVPTTVSEFVALGLVGLRLGREERTQRLRDVLATVGLEGIGGQDFWELSGGQRQRAMIARALVRRPMLLVLDEPTASLDPAAEGVVLDMLAEVNRSERVTVLFVTHDLDIASHYASHVALFHDGRVSAGPREEAMRLENLERIFGAEFGERLGTLGGHCA